MAISMYQISVAPLLHTAGAMSGVLDKAIAFAAAKKIDQSVLLQARLAPDMFPFVKQIQMVSDFAKDSPERLAGLSSPDYEDYEKTLEELKARLSRTIEHLKGFKPAQIDGTEAKEIVYPLGPGKSLTFTGLQFLMNFVLPNFYFHAATAYDILRHNGVELGKRDFLGKS